MTDLNGLTHYQNKMPIFFETENENEFFETAKEDIVLSIKETLTHSQSCKIGLSGGSTPENLYKLLANEHLPWEKLIFVLIDERYVPSDDPESNLRMIRRALFSHAPIQPENIIYFDTSLPYESTAKEMNRKLRQIGDLDILILGAGEDGHIASLFDNDEAIFSNDFATIANAQGYPIQDRLTLTLSFLKNSKKVFLLLKGYKKAAIYEEIKLGANRHTALSTILKNEFVKVYFSL